jgi:hypothetical protein
MRRMRIITRILAAASLMAATSCSSTVRSGDSPMFLVINTLQGIAGGPTPGAPSSVLFSDVETIMTSGIDSAGNQCTQTAPCRGFVFNDSGQVVLSLARKDVSAATAPTTNNQVTINRIRIHYRLADGSGVQGVTVPVDFDTFATATVPPGGTVSIGFELIRAAAKRAAPLVGLVGGGQLGATADVTFFGTDQIGNAISVTGSIQIEFANWAG